MKDLRLALLVGAPACVALAMGVASAAPPRPIDPVPPQYPKWAIGTGVRTDVELKALIGSNGKVRQVAIVPYNVRNDFLTREMRASFDSAAVRAVRSWTFAPATRDGHAMTVWWTLRVPFVDPEDAGGLAADSSMAWSDTVAAPGEVGPFPEPIHREMLEWPAAVPYLCRGHVAVRIFPDHKGRVMGARVTRFSLDCQDPGIRAAVDFAVVRAALRWRYRAGEDEGAPFLVEFEIPPPRLDVDVVVGCVRDSLTGKPRPGADIFGRDHPHPFGNADDIGWFVLRGAATRAPMLRARYGQCRWSGYRAVRLWTKPGDELTLVTGRKCVDATR